MKVKPWEADGFVRAADAKVRAVLLFGPDDGLARERARVLGRQVVGDLNDPFRVANIAGAELGDDPARLGDEAAAISMTGGRRLIRIEGATETATTALAAFLDHPRGDSLIVVTAGDLKPRSRLRRIFEASPVAAAVPCYADDPRALEALIREVLGAQGRGIEPAALDFLLAHLGADRAVSRGELDKLALYMSGAGAAAEVTLEDAAACVGDSAALSLDQATDAMLAGDLGALDRALARTFSAGQSPISVLRAASGRLRRLHRLTALVDRGTAFETAVRKLRPPAFSREARLLSGYLGHWPAGKLIRALEIVTEAELRCKATGMPAETVCARACLSVAAAARR